MLITPQNQHPHLGYRCGYILSSSGQKQFNWFNGSLNWRGLNKDYLFLISFSPTLGAPWPLAREMNEHNDIANDIFPHPAPDMPLECFCWCLFKLWLAAQNQFLFFPAVNSGHCCCCCSSSAHTNCPVLHSFHKAIVRKTKPELNPPRQQCPVTSIWCALYMTKELEIVYQSRSHIFWHRWSDKKLGVIKGLSLCGW